MAPDNSPPTSPPGCESGGLDDDCSRDASPHSLVSINFGRRARDFARIDGKEHRSLGEVWACEARVIGFRQKNKACRRHQSRRSSLLSAEGRSRRRSTANVGRRRTGRSRSSDGIARETASIITGIFGMMWGAEHRARHDQNSLDRDYVRPYYTLTGKRRFAIKELTLWLPGR
jgi:hypothetical protein